MTKAEIVAVIAALPHRDRRELLADILAMEPDYEVYDEQAIANPQGRDHTRKAP